MVIVANKQVVVCALWSFDQLPLIRTHLRAACDDAIFGSGRSRRSGRRRNSSSCCSSCCSYCSILLLHPPRHSLYTRRLFSSYPRFPCCCRCIHPRPPTLSFLLHPSTQSPSNHLFHPNPLRISSDYYPPPLSAASHARELIDIVRPCRFKPPFSTK